MLPFINNIVNEGGLFERINVIEKHIYIHQILEDTQFSFTFEDRSNSIPIKLSAVLKNWSLYTRKKYPSILKIIKSIIISRNTALRVEQAVFLNKFLLLLPTDIHNCGEHSQGKSSS